MIVMPCQRSTIVSRKSFILSHCAFSENYLKPKDVLQGVFLHLWRNPDSDALNHGPLWTRLALAARNRSTERGSTQANKSEPLPVTTYCRPSNS